MSDDTITDEEYATVQQQLGLLSNLLRDIPLAAFIRKIDRCEAVAPLFNPTLYMVGNAKLDCVKRMASAFLAAQQRLPTQAEWEEAERRTNSAARAAGVTVEGLRAAGERR